MGMKAAKTAAVIVGLALIFAAGSLIEANLRSNQRTALPVRLEGGLRVQVEACVWPDFLWVGKAWRIKIVSAEPITLDLDGKWQADLPPGTHSIFANHDTTNTAQFGPQKYWEAPTQITVSPRQCRIEAP